MKINQSNQIEEILNQKIIEYAAEKLGRHLKIAPPQFIPIPKISPDKDWYSIIQIIGESFWYTVRLYFSSKNSNQLILCQFKNMPTNISNKFFLEQLKECSNVLTGNIKNLFAMNQIPCKLCLPLALKSNLELALTFDSESIARYRNTIEFQLKDFTMIYDYSLEAGSQEILEHIKEIDFDNSQFKDPEIEIL